MIRKGTPWGRAIGGPADCEISGDDVALAEAVARNPQARVAFHPTASSDFARAVGVGVRVGPADDNPTTELPCDLLRVHVDDRDVPAVNMVIAGAPPDRQTRWSASPQVRVRVDGREVHDGRATAVVIASGQYLRGVDLVPRGHPGDGRAEVHVYSLARSERRAMRARLPRGEHVPHPRIATTSGQDVLVESLVSAIPVEIDGLGRGRATAIRVEVTPEAFFLLV
jgi:hypothetical protein